MAYYMNKNVPAKRGDIFYISNSKCYATDPSNTEGRPAIVVSSDKLNEHADVVEVVYLTTKEKRLMPTHAEVLCKIPSTALCETIYTVNKDRLGDFVRTCTDKEMEGVNAGILCSLGIAAPMVDGEVMDMGKGADMSWEDIQNEFDIMNRMSCRPVGLQKVPGNHIFDEDQSVKWNREQVELNNKKYQSEVARLNTEKNKARDSVYNLIIEKIQYEVGHRLSRKKAEAIWNRAYEDGHSFGFYEIRCRLSDLIDLAITLLGGDK